jgi:hypothetical protein
MPNYLFCHPKTGEIVEVFQNCNEAHEFSRDGVKWNRVWTVPNAGIDTNIDPFDKRKFIDKTYQGKVKLGDMWAMSAEMSEKRKQKLGTKADPVKEEYKKQYSKDRQGKKLVGE